MENVFDNTLQIIELFNYKIYSDIKYKIKELKNTALLTLKILKNSKQLEKDNEDLLNKLVNASIYEGKELLNNNIASLKKIFSYLPDEEELVQIFKEISKEIKDPENIDNSLEDLEIDAINDNEQIEYSENEDEYNKSEEMVDEELKEEITVNSDIDEDMINTDEKSIVESEEISKNTDNDDELRINENQKIYLKTKCQ